MPVRVWLHACDEERFTRYADVALEHYGGEGKDEIATAEIKSGLLSHLKQDFVLGKVKFWEKEGYAHRTAWVRVDNHPAYPGGMAFTPHDWINTRYCGKTKTIDQRTGLKRVQLLAAPNNDFIRRVFITYAADFKVCKPSEHERHLLVYCDEQHLYKGKIAARH